MDWGGTTCLCCLKPWQWQQVEWEREALPVMTVWPSGLRRWLKAPFRKGVGSNPTAVTFKMGATAKASLMKFVWGCSFRAWLRDIFMLWKSSLSSGSFAKAKICCDRGSRSFAKSVEAWNDMAVWPSGLRRWLQAPVRKGVGSNPTAVTFSISEG